MVDETFREKNMNSEIALRSLAENRIEKSLNETQELKDKPTELIIHELRVHQVELEIQNEELRRAQLELEESRDKFLDLYDFAPVGYLTLDKNYLIVEANITGATLLGVERASLINRPLTSFIHKDDQDSFYFHRNLVLKDRLQHICEIRMRRSDDSWFHCRLQSAGISGSKGISGRCRTVLSDISGLVEIRDELRRSHDELESKVKERTADLMRVNDELRLEIVERELGEAKLSDSEKRLNLVLTGAGLGSWHYDIKSKETTCDQDLATMLGFELADTQRHLPWWESLTHPDDLLKAKELFSAHLGGASPFYEAEFRVRSTLGDWKWILARGSIIEWDKDGAPSKVAGTYLDISEKKEIQEKLHVSEERFRAFFECAQDLIFIMNNQLKYVHVNPAMIMTHGLNRSQIIGRRSTDLYGEKVGQELRMLDLRVLGGETIEREHAVKINGVSLILNTILKPLSDSDGKIVGIFGISRDVTDRAKLRPKIKTVFEKYTSDAMKATMREARFAAASEGSVLLQGESGSGKDYLARWIHDHSKRSIGPYFSLNCAAISRELAESELFGHERGAFTGAHGRKRGLLELAEGGTLLLNEIGELPLDLQSKLLTFLDTKSFLRVGGEKSLKVNARIISATNRSLEEEVQEGRFLSALYYRINVFGITMPPLRDRIEDIPVLLEELMSRLAEELQLKIIPYVDPASVIALARYDWPGNVRELRNALERSLMLSDGRRLNLSLPSAKDIPLNWSHVSIFPSDERTLHDVTDEVIESLCLEALRRCEGNRRCAARTLGIARDSLYRYMKRFGIGNEDQTKD